MNADALTVYWRPDCSSCLRVKEYLAQRGIAYRSVNVLADPQALPQLAAHGIRSIPALQRADGRWVSAQFIDDVAAFLGTDAPARTTLDAGALAARLIELLRATERYVRQLTPEQMHRMIDGPQRSHGDVAFHVFRIAEAFVGTARAGVQRDAMIVMSIPPTLRTPAELAGYGGRIVALFADWWDQHGVHALWDRTIRTEHGDKSLREVFERSTWHAAQHVRQVMSLWRELGIELDAPLPGEVFDGLPLPSQVRDRLNTTGDTQ